MIELKFSEVPTEFSNRDFECDKHGKPYCRIVNVITALLNPKYAQKDGILQGTFFYDSFAQQIKIQGRVAGEYSISPDQIRQIDDNIINKLGVEIERQYGVKFNKKDTIEALRFVAGLNAINPAQEYIKSLVWDKDEQAIRKLLPTYLGADDTELNAWIMEHMLVGMVKRIFEPGCKFDEMMVLFGDQGLGKSTFTRYLSLNDEWFCSLESIQGKDAIMNIRGKAVVEIEEFVALRSVNSADKAKSFISKLSDRIRPPYDQFSRDIPRTSIMIGTLNELTFLNDHTGERRYLPVECSIKKRKKSVYPKEEYLNGMTMKAYEKEVKKDFEMAVAYAYKLYREEKHSFIIPDKFLESLDEIRDECKYLNPDVENVRYFLEAYKPKTHNPTVTCWKEICEQGYGIKSKAFSEIIANYFPEWEKISLKKTQIIYPNGEGIPVKCYYRKKETAEENNERLLKDLPEEWKVDKGETKACNEEEQYEQMSLSGIEKL